MITDFSLLFLSAESFKKLPFLFEKLSNNQLPELFRNDLLKLILCLSSFCWTSFTVSIIQSTTSIMDANDGVVMVQKQIVVDYQEQKAYAFKNSEGHDLALHILYHLYSLTSLDSAGNNSYLAALYENFLFTMATSLLNAFPASDKSFSKLLCEVPIVPDSSMKLLGDLCHADVVDQHGTYIRDVDRVTQGLGAVWSLILGRPCYRQACLDIALKCAVHLQDEIRAKAIRLVTNKLYQLSYVVENIEQFATIMLQSVVDNQASDLELLPPESTEQRTATMFIEAVLLHLSPITHFECIARHLLLHDALHHGFEIYESVILKK
ncbi:hypothetical protein G4B88_007894 [Cannabis sativa]|uniref:Uncharacterized protein n=1 Tax=Cannabis sativa TaxID=3483 RepID=A0A7J6EJV3_CANSA|nr:hypothetical protein G4B88_007894 [Cannabis sativa]